MKKQIALFFLTVLFFSTKATAQKLIPHYAQAFGVEAFFGFEPYGYDRNFAHQSEFLFNNSPSQGFQQFKPTNDFGYTTYAMHLYGLGGLYKQIGLANYTPATEISFGAYVNFAGMSTYALSGPYKPAILAYDRGQNVYTSNGQAYALIIEEDASSAVTGFKLVATIYTDAGQLALEYQNFPTSEFVHVAGTWSASSKTFDLYINGQIVNSVVNGSATVIDYGTGSYFLIGGTSLSSYEYCYNGSIDDVFLYSTKLSSAAIQNLANRKHFEMFFPLNNTLESTVNAQTNFILNSSETPTFSSNGQSGFIGDLCYFDTTATNQLTGLAIDTANSFLINTTADLFAQSFTTALWVNLDSIKQQQYTNFFELGYAYFFRLLGNTIQVGYRNSYVANNYAIVSSTNIDRGDWIHLAVTAAYDSTTQDRAFKIYVNGELKTTIPVFLNDFETPIEYNFTEDYAFGVGCRTNTVSNLKLFGAMQDVYFSNKVVDDCHIADLYQRNKLFYNASDTLLHATLDTNIVWINCDSSTVVDSNQVFTPTQTGNYACVYLNSCGNDTTDCIFIDLSIIQPNSIETNAATFTVRFYPNPSSSFIHINNSEPVSCKIIDLTGKLVDYFILNQTNNLVSTQNYTNGIYIIQFTNSNGESISQKLFVNH